MKCRGGVIPLLRMQMCSSCSGNSLVCVISRLLRTTNPTHLGRPGKPIFHSTNTSDTQQCCRKRRRSDILRSHDFVWERENGKTEAIRNSEVSAPQKFDLPICAEAVRPNSAHIRARHVFRQLRAVHVERRRETAENRHAWKHVSNLAKN